jgi:CHAD domain-containing protein
VTGAPAREVEAKFRVHPPFRLPELAGPATGVAAVRDPVAARLTAVYYDTADLRLAREGITVRHRTGEGAGDGWHLKLPAGPVRDGSAETAARDELTWTGGPAQLPERLRDLLTAYLRGAAVGPVATLVTDRSTYRLEGADGEPLAELTDDTVCVLDHGHVAGRFREVEIEDRRGGPALLRTLGQALRGAGAVGGEFVPKVVRALGPQATRPPDPPPPARVGPKDPAAEAVQAILRGYVRTLMTRDIAVRRGQPDSVHQMRVACRRLRAALKSFRPLLDPAWADGLRAELSWLAGELGAARDGEVLLAHLEAALDGLPGELVLERARALVQQRVGGDLARAGEQVSAALAADRYVGLLDRLVDGAWQPMVGPAAAEPAGPALAGLVDANWRKLRRCAEPLLDDPDAPDEAWHRARIAAKRTRYAAEAAQPVLGSRAGKFARAVEALQELLGAHQDAVLARQVLRGLATAPRTGAAAFTFGVLYAGETERIAAARARFPAAWRRAAAPAHRKWLSA